MRFDAGLDQLLLENVLDTRRDDHPVDRYAPSFVAHLMVSKCSESTPQYRLEKFYRNIGIPISRSTMGALLHRGADELRPLHVAALALVPKAPDVHHTTAGP